MLVVDTLWDASRRRAADSVPHCLYEVPCALCPMSNPLTCHSSPQHPQRTLPLGDGPSQRHQERIGPVFGHQYPSLQCDVSTGRLASLHRPPRVPMIQ